MSAGRINPDTVRELFANGMKCHIAWELPNQPPGVVLNLGSGNSPISGAINLDAKVDKNKLPGRNEETPGDYRWYATYLDYDDGAVAAIHAYHFLEHLSYEELDRMMKEIERVLRDGGLLYYCVPYALAPIAFMDASHKTFWTEETMRTLLESRGYDSASATRLKYWMQTIIGVNSQNLAVLGCLQKREI